MIRMSTTSLRPGMVIGKPVFNVRGDMLLGRGVTLNDFYILKLEKFGISSVYIQDDSHEDVIPNDNIPDAMRSSVLQNFSTLGDVVDDLKKEMRDDSFRAIRSAIGSGQFQQTFKSHPVFTRLKQDVFNIVEELLDGDAVIGLNSIKTFDTYTFQHSIDVCIVSIMIGRAIGFSKTRLRELGLGSILHDIGKILLPKEVVLKRGNLTSEEMNIIQQHPEIGFEILRELPGIGVLPPHVILQHHEKQDGTGYPRGLKGTNVITISSGNSMSTHLYSDICAVADVFDALSSDKVYNRSLLPEEVITVMRGLKGTHLNRQVLSEFFKITPVYPKGNCIVVKSGEYTNYIGVVTTVNQSDFERPNIRLIYGPEKKAIDPIDLFLSNHPNIKIQNILL